MAIFGVKLAARLVRAKEVHSNTKNAIWTKKVANTVQLTKKSNFIVREIHFSDCGFKHVVLASPSSLSRRAQWTLGRRLQSEAETCSLFHVFVG